MSDGRDGARSELASRTRSASARPYSPPTWHVGFDPESFDRIMPVRARSVEVQVHLLDQWDRPIRRAGVPISVSQTTSGRRGVVSLTRCTPGRRHRGRDQRAGPGQGDRSPTSTAARRRSCSRRGRRAPAATHTPGAQERSSFASRRLEPDPAAAQQADLVGAQPPCAAAVQTAEQQRPEADALQLDHAVADLLRTSA